MSSHRLVIEVEAGRWKNKKKTNRVPLSDRKCSSCQTLEDEYHFILECKIYIDLRRRLIPKYFWIRPNMHKFIELMNCTNRGCIRKLGTYIYQAFKRRTELLY